MTDTTEHPGGGARNRLRAMTTGFLPTVSMGPDKHATTIEPIRIA